MNFIILLLPLLAIFLLFRSQKKRQSQMQTMQQALEPGAGVRTIGGLYALVKSVNEETVELEIAPGVVTHFTKGAVAAVLDPLEYDAIINGRPAEDDADELGEPVEDVDAHDAEDKPLSLDKDKSGNSSADGGAPESK
ncbi:preprotein translocase subunit YajC [Kitasatospora sp. NPDC048540]|uniref:preprotein translocase subunit YajC n=1 Tax=unclassified Kitasatospora TaxID=2633591 RepID=UPI00068AC75B|nr:preprotein translocase subunit YajC [Kitasatospora sp. MBT63]